MDWESKISYSIKNETREILQEPCMRSNFFFTQMDLIVKMEENICPKLMINQEKLKYRRAWKQLDIHKQY